MAYKKLKLWFDKDLAKDLAKKISKVDPSFNGTSFIKSTSKQLAPLELKARVEVFADELYHHFDEDYEQAMDVLLKILGPENEEETGMFTEYYWIMPIAKFVEKYGLHNFKLSMVALEEITKRNTSEYAVRPFIEKDQKKMQKQLLKWSKNPNRHIRRLASEGIRPRLPWASKFDFYIEDPTPILPILNKLKADPSKYVQKSVANCINDIFKDNLEIGKGLVDEWLSDQPTKETKWIIKHSIRKLLKNEDKWARGVEKKVKRG